jgi:hypothetical protein
VRGALRIRGPLTIDQLLTLKALGRKFSHFRIGYDEDAGRWLASRRDGTGSTLRGLTPDDLAAAMRAGAR